MAIAFVAHGTGKWLSPYSGTGELTYADAGGERTESFSLTMVYRDYGNTVSCRFPLFSERHEQGNTPGEEISVIASGAAEEKRLPGMSMMAEL